MCWRLQGATQPQKELIEQAAQLVATDNTELACAFIQKTAVEKAIPEIDKRLATVSRLIFCYGTSLKDLPLKNVCYGERKVQSVIYLVQV